MSKSFGVTFEVQSFKGDRWITEVICKTEEEARVEVAKVSNQREGMRILRELNSASGSRETVIFSEMRAGTQATINAQPIEEAPVCEQSKQMLGDDSRKTINKILRQYLAKRSLTASELLYSPSEMRKVMNFENLVPASVGRVATLQAKATSGDMRERRDLLYNMMGELRTKAEGAAKLNLPNAKNEGLSALTQAAAAAGDDPEEKDYLAKFVLCTDLVHIQNLLGKIEWLITLAAGGEAEPWHMEVLDALVSDACANATVIQDLLGRQPDLGTALSRLLEIITGTYQKNEREQAPEITAVLSVWLGSGNAPQTSAVLMDGVLKALAGSQPLCRGTREEQRVGYADLLVRVMTPTGFVGGPSMAEALTTGYLRFIEQGGAEGRRISVDGICTLLKTGAERMLYLITLSGSQLGLKVMETLVARIGDQLSTASGVNGLVPPTTPLKPKMQTMATLYRLLSSCDVPEADRAVLADKLDEVIVGYIVGANIIEKLDDPSAPLRVRATRLIQFAANDVLASPKARKLVQQQIIGHLRQPNFDGKFVEGLQGDDAARALRNFYDVLRQAQFI